MAHLQEIYSTPQWNKPIAYAEESAICTALTWKLFVSTGFLLKFLNMCDLTVSRITYLVKRNVFFVMENPSTSLLWRYKCVKELRLMLRIRSWLFITEMVMSTCLCGFNCFKHFVCTSTKNLLRKHNCISITTSLGAFGGLSPKLATWNGNCSRVLHSSILVKRH